MARVEDDEFKAAAKQAEAEERAKAAERKARAANGGGFTKISGRQFHKHQECLF